MDADRPSAPAAAAMSAAGALLVAAAFVPWFDQGIGATMTLREIGDFLLSDRIRSLPRWTGSVAYVVPVGGGLAITAAGLRRRPARVLVAVVAGVVAGICAAAALTAGEERNLTTGWYLAVIGTVVLGGTAVVMGRSGAVRSAGGGRPEQG